MSYPLVFHADGKHAEKNFIYMENMWKVLRNQANSSYFYNAIHMMETLQPIFSVDLRRHAQYNDDVRRMHPPPVGVRAHMIVTYEGVRKNDHIHQKARRACCSF